MILTELAKPLKSSGAKPIQRTNQTAPGFDWKLSDEAKRDIEEIEANARTAEQRTASIVLR